MNESRSRVEGKQRENTAVGGRNEGEPSQGRGVVDMREDESHAREANVDGPRTEEELVERGWFVA